MCSIFVDTGKYVCPETKIYIGFIKLRALRGLRTYLAGHKTVYFVVKLL